MECDNNALVREFVITDSLRKLIAKNIEEISASKHLLQRLFTEATRIMMSEVDAEIYVLRREMSRRKLRIVSDETANGTKGSALTVRYTVRDKAGIYEEKAELQREELRQEIGLRLARRMKAMERRASEAEKEKAEKDKSEVVASDQR